MGEIYRVRRGLFGKSVLQKLINTPSLIGGQVDATVRDIHWVDVDYRSAPIGLMQDSTREPSE